MILRGVFEYRDLLRFGFIRICRISYDYTMYALI